MDRESVERLRFDRRLQRRRGWLEQSVLEEHLESLPDVSEKMTTAAELEAEQATEADSAEGAGGSAPTETAGSFSGGSGEGFGGGAGSFGGDPGGTPLS